MNIGGKNNTHPVIPVIVIAAILALLSVFAVMLLSQDDKPPKPDQDTEVVSDSGNIAVSSPSPSDSVGLPLVVEGRARVFENTVNLRLRDSDGSVLVEDFTTAQAQDVGEFGPFSAELFYPEPNGTSGTLEVFSESAKDGTEINKVQIAVNFSNVDALVVRVYLTTDQTGVDTCQATDFVERRIPHTQATGRASLQQLLAGPTVTEQKAGFTTSIIAGTELQSLTIENGTAHADFNETLDENIGGSCLVTAIYTQIANTLLQFPTVDNVVVSINGETEEVLQP